MSRKSLTFKTPDRMKVLALIFIFGMVFSPSVRNLLHKFFILLPTSFRLMIELITSMIIVGATQVSPTTMNVDLLLSDGTIITTTESVQDYNTFSSITK
jgi:hypothetical protein